MMPTRFTIRSSRRFIALLLSAAGALLLATPAQSATAEKPVRIGFSAEPYPPFSYKSPDGKWTGFELEMQHAVCAAAKITCEPTPTAWSGIILALEIGKIDAIMNSLTITPERLKKVAFSKPYFIQHLELVFPKGSKITDLKDLKGKVLGVQGATFAATYAQEKLQPLGVQIKIYNEQDQLTLDLKSHRVDAMIAENVYTQPLVKETPTLEAMPVPNAPKQEVAIALRKGDTQLKETFDKAIDKVVEDGTCKKLSAQFVHVDVCPEAGQ